MPVPIQNYSELQTTVANWLKNDQISARIPQFIGLAENRINNELDITDIESTVDITIDAQEVALPTGFLEQRSHYIDVSDPLQRVKYATPEQFRDYDQNKAAGFPSWYTIEGGNLVFSPPPDATYTGKWLILQRLPRLVNDGDTNEILENHSGLYLYGALIEAEPFLGNDPRVLTWATMYENAMDLAIELGQRRRFPKGQKVMRSKVGITSGGRTKM